MLYNIIKKFFFVLPPEIAHHFTVKQLDVLFKLPLLKKITHNRLNYTHKSLSKELFGIHFPNPVGLAAGFDKDAKMVENLMPFGFGFIEVGTVTPKPQIGNPKPRLFRIIKDEAIINRMGFNNDGVDNMVHRLVAIRKKNTSVIIGGNIGKNKTTPNEKALEDYTYCFNKLFDYVDYFVVNVSSPNTPNLRALQSKDALKIILDGLQHINQQKKNPKPILLKIAPDLNSNQLDDIIEIVQSSKINGLIATNTTIERNHMQSHKAYIKKIGAGGLSGKPLKNKSTEIIRYIHKQSGGQIPIIGVGGIMSPEDALEKIQAGASLVQVYSGFIYYGPTLIKDTNQYIADHI